MSLADLHLWLPSSETCSQFRSFLPALFQLISLIIPLLVSLPYNRDEVISYFQSQPGTGYITTG